MSSEQQQKPRISVAQAVCFGIGITIGLSIVRIGLNQTDAIAGAIGGAFGALIGIVLFAVYSRIKG